jgi:hypothetical protein
VAEAMAAATAMLLYGRKRESDADSEMMSLAERTRGDKESRDDTSPISSGDYERLVEPSVSGDTIEVVAHTGCVWLWNHDC